MRIKDRLLEKFHAFRYRHAYMDEFTDAFIATQIKVLREQQGLTQTDLADKAGMKQSQVSDLENVNHRSWKVRTLKKLAKAFDLTLVVRFETFGHVLPDIGHLDRHHLQRSEFKDDTVFFPDASASTETVEDLVSKKDKSTATILNSSARFSNQFDTQVPNVA